MGKVWVQQNNTEIQLGEELEKRGIEPLDIVDRDSDLTYMRPCN